VSNGSGAAQEVDLHERKSDAAEQSRRIRYSELRAGQPASKRSGQRTLRNMMVANKGKELFTSSQWRSGMGMSTNAPKIDRKIAFADTATTVSANTDLRANILAVAAFERYTSTV
jgi:hypothetical protein